MKAQAPVNDPVVLIVEDRPDALSARIDLFKASGFQPIGAASFGEAVDHFRGEDVDIVVADINLLPSIPNDRSGLDFATFVKQQRPGLPIIGYSAMFSEDSLRQRDRELFDDYLSKGDFTSVSRIADQLEEWRRLALSRRIVARRRGANPKHYDVFLSHNSTDRRTVRRLARILHNQGLFVWLDEWELVPGRPWQEAIEEIIETTRTAAILVGNDGIGPWEDREMRACLAEFVRREVPVIPVLLPGAPHEPGLPLFLKQFTWVDLRHGLRKLALARLVWGITGHRPETGS